MNYNSLAKDEKRKLKDNYYKTKKGNELGKIFLRLIIEGILCLGIAIGIMVYSIFNEVAWYYYTLVVVLVISGITFLVGQAIIKNKEYNKFLKSDKKRK